MSHPVFVQATDQVFVNMNAVKIVRFNKEGNKVLLELGDGIAQPVEQAFQAKFADVLEALVKPDRGNPKAKLD